VHSDNDDDDDRQSHRAEQNDIAAVSCGNYAVFLWARELVFTVFTRSKTVLKHTREVA